jgi:cohesin loading factor subunit SCC2
MSGMGQYDTGGSQNGVSSRQRPSRPLSFRESLPYSPQTTTLPFVPDLIPNPTLGSGSSVLSTSDILPSTDLHQLNKEAEDQGHLSRNGKQAAESIIHEIKPSQRTQ